MPANKSSRAKLTKRVVEAAKPAKARYILWDSVIPGFGLRVAPVGTKTFILRYRPGRVGRSAPKRFVTIGRFGPVTAEKARLRAMTILGEVAEGKDPAFATRAERAAITVANAAREFLSMHVDAKRKPNTQAFYHHAFENKILPVLGQRKLLDVSREDAARLHYSMRATPYMANRVIAVLGSFYSWAGRRGLVPEDFNPARRLEKFREGRRERFLTSDELLRIGEALREAETRGIPWNVDESRSTAKHAPKADKRFTMISPHAVAAIRLLLFTGCRRQEILDLQWEHVDIERGVLFLPDSKTGRKTVMLGAPALEVLSRLPRTGAYVISGADPERPRVGLKRPWSVIRRRAGLVGVRLHDLRHSYASVGAGAGLGLPIIGRLLGHKQPSTTARYAHLADDPLRQASETIASRIAVAMGESSSLKMAVSSIRRRS
jgi:integrase